MVSPDAELFILSFARLAVALLLDPNNATYLEAQREIERRLRESFAVTELQMVAHSTRDYTVACKFDAEQKLFTFPSEDVESFP